MLSRAPEVPIGGRARERGGRVKDLTDRQREVLSFIKSFSERHGVPPTVREIGDRFRFTARAAFDHLRALERKGMLRRRASARRVSRTLVPLDREPARRPPAQIPILGRIAAACPGWPPSCR